MNEFTNLSLEEKRSHIYRLLTCIPEARENIQIVTLIDIVTTSEDESFLGDLYQQILLSEGKDPMEVLMKIYAKKMTEIHQKFTTTAIKAQEYNQKKNDNAPDELLKKL